eukprot:TRINITY_DN10577_c0_g1_i1.p1 TRINITY_DN10577_c0_g1~~TRINITY_DN10577_c0_g1_i1.p1  ORF type:complete len:131 (-),score=7.24 TRINITY_DN10577_c0_g1_i1:198-590(-)
MRHFKVLTKRSSTYSNQLDDQVRVVQVSMIPINELSHMKIKTFSMIVGLLIFLDVGPPQLSCATTTRERNNRLSSSLDIKNMLIEIESNLRTWKRPQGVDQISKGYCQGEERYFCSSLFHVLSLSRLQDQ